MTEMLTIKQTAERIKAQFPDTPIGEHALRIWQKENRFRSIYVGRKILISWVSVERFLSGADEE